MTVLTFSIVIFFVSIFSGIIGALTGLGGGAILIPALVLGFQVNIHYAMGASLISVMATASGTSVAYLREGYTNLRIAIFLEIAVLIGVFIGAYLTHLLPTRALVIIFGVVFIFSAYRSLPKKTGNPLADHTHPWAQKLQLNSTYPTEIGMMQYQVKDVPLGFFIMWIAGTLAGLLGIGSGALKVLAMDQVMGLPYKVSTTTSNYMIGITAAASASIYFMYGYIEPSLCFPVMLGVLTGAFIGAKILTIAKTQLLRIIFSAVVFLLAVQMIYQGTAGN